MELTRQHHNLDGYCLECMNALNAREKQNEIGLDAVVGARGEGEMTWVRD